MDQPQGFSCDITQIPGLEEQVFGNKTLFYRNKKLAKVQAAKHAMQFINATNPPLPESALKTKLGRRTAAASAGGNFVGGAQLLPSGSIINIPFRAGPVESVTIICPKLGMALPEYDITQDPTAPAIYDVTASIRRQQGKTLRIGPMKGIYGRRNAKERMAESLMILLKNQAEQLGITIRRVD